MPAKQQDNCFAKYADQKGWFETTAGANKKAAPIGAALSSLADTNEISVLSPLVGHFAQKFHAHQAQLFFRKVVA